MPTASTSQILGNNESFEPFTSNIYTRRVLSGEYICVNKHLVRDLIKLGLWTSSIKNQIIADNGSVQGIKEIPDNFKQIYKTVWEIKQRQMIDLAVSRGPYICQSQSLNLYMKDPDPEKMTSMHFNAWRKGLKTGQYYFRSQPARDAIKFTVNVESLLKAIDSGKNNQIMDVLNSENNRANIGKKKRISTDKPASLEAKKPALPSKPEAKEDLKAQAQAK